jgi:hypothetical protein
MHYRNNKISQLDHLLDQVNRTLSLYFLKICINSLFLYALRFATGLTSNFSGFFKELYRSTYHNKLDDKHYIMI